MNPKTWLFLPLIVMGAAWGLTIPLLKISISTGYNAVGLIFWQILFAGSIAFILSLPKLRKIKLNKRRLILFGWVAAFGSLVPGMISITAVEHLPAGVMAITIAMVPIFIMPIAIATGHEIFQPTRALGVLMGALAIFLLIGPDTSLPDPTKAIFVLLALVSPFCYAIEDNFIAYFGLDEMTPLEAVLGSSVLGLILISSYIFFQGGFIPLWENGWDNADVAVVVAGMMHGVAYSGYIWMIGKAGPVFAGLVAYLVTIFGVVWSIILLGEAYSGYIWSAFLCMLIGMYLVRPR